MRGLDGRGNQEFSSGELHSFRFQTMNDNGEALGPILTGEVKRVFRQGRQIAVEFYLPDKHCTHIHEAKRIYYKGRA